MQMCAVAVSVCVSASSASMRCVRLGRHAWSPRKVDLGCVKHPTLFKVSLKRSQKNDLGKYQFHGPIFSPA